MGLKYYLQGMRRLKIFHQLEKVQQLQISRFCVKHHIQMEHQISFKNFSGKWIRSFEGLSVSNTIEYIGNNQDTNNGQMSFRCAYQLAAAMLYKPSGDP